MCPFFYSDVLSFLDDISMKYESPMRLWFGPQMVVFVADAENAEIVLKSKDCLNKPYDFYKILRDALSVDGFFTLKGNYFHNNTNVLNNFEISTMHRRKPHC